MFSKMIARAIGALLIVTLLPANVHALGLGDIDLDSHLNEKFQASIELFDAEGLRSDEIIVSLASAEDFERVGVERFFFLTNLRFNVETQGGVPKVVVTSAQPISEPYLNFMVEVLWPQGRLLKEYTVLLDPPTYTATVSAPSVGEPVREQATTQRSEPVSRAPAARAPTSRVAPAPRRGTQVNLADRGGERVAPAAGEAMTTQHDTLWSIANRYRPSTSISVNQYMLAIQRANPEAFIDQNINLVKAGVVLRMPAAEAAQSIGTAQAASEVARQTDVWRGISRPSAEQVADNARPALRQQVDATPQRDSNPSEVVSDSGRLQIVAGEGDVAQGKSDEGLAQAAEENDRLSRQVDELSYQLDREKEQATDQIAVRDRQLEVKDQELAALRAELEKTRAQLQNIENNPQSESQSRPEAPSKPFWESPSMLLLGAAAAVVLALIGGLIFMRRRQQAQQDAVYASATQDETQADFTIGDVSDQASEDDELFALDELDEHERAPSEPDEETLDLLDDLDELDDEQVAAQSSDSAAPAPALQTSDVIGEADIYAAYGRYPHAIGLLTGALDEDADRHDVRLKLLEVCVAAEDLQTFDQHLGELIDRCSDQDILLAARELEESLPEREASPDRSFTDTASIAAGVVAAGAASNALLGSEEDDHDELFDLEDEGDDDIPELDDLDDLGDEVDALLSGLDDDLQENAAEDSSIADIGAELTDELDEESSEESFDLSFEDDALTDVLDELGEEDGSDDTILGGGPSSAEEADDELDFLDDLELDETGTVAEAPLGAAAADGDLDDLLGDMLEEDEELADAEELLSLDDDEEYTPLVDAQSGAAEDSLGGDLGFDFDPDKAVGEVSERGLDLELPVEDELEIEDLLAELDADSDLLDESIGSDDQAGAFAQVVNDDAEVDAPELDDLDLDSNEGELAVPVVDDAEASPLAEVVTDDFDDDVFTDDDDAADTKLDLAQAYIDMGDEDGARDILGEVLQEGTEHQRGTAQSLLDSLAS